MPILETDYGDLNCLLYFQAYYGPRVAMPPYYNSPVASGHTPHPYMWGPPQVITQTSIIMLYNITILCVMSWHIP
jgi:plant G-box-binding factor